MPDGQEGKEGTSKTPRGKAHLVSALRSTFPKAGVLRRIGQHTAANSVPGTDSISVAIATSPASAVVGAQPLSRVFQQAVRSRNHQRSHCLFVQLQAQSRASGNCAVPINGCKTSLE